MGVIGIGIERSEAVGDSFSTQDRGSEGLSVLCRVQGFRINPHEIWTYNAKSKWRTKIAGSTKHKTNDGAEERDCKARKEPMPCSLLRVKSCKLSDEWERRKSRFDIQGGSLASLPSGPVSMRSITT